MKFRNDGCLIFCFEIAVKEIRRLANLYQAIVKCANHHYKPNLRPDLKISRTSPTG